MAKKKATPEELIVSFFTTAELPSATTLFNVVKGLMNTRNAAGAPAAAPKKTSTRASNKNTTAATTAAAAAPTAAAVAEAA